MGKTNKPQSGQNRLPKEQAQPKQQTQPKQQSRPKVKVQEGETWDAELLREVKYFTIVLNDGEKFKAKFIAMNKFHVQVETETGVLLIPKHSIKYYVLEEFGEGQD